MTLTREEISLGDVVRLRNGEEIRVRGVSDWYEDREGRHDGPWVIAYPYDRYLLADVDEVVRRNERRCRFCGEGVTATSETVDYCEGCHYSGQAATASRDEQIARMAAAIGDGVFGWVEHTGGGCFWLAFRFPGDPSYYVATNGEASLPCSTEDDSPLLSGGWGYVGRHNDTDGHPDYEGTTLRYAAEADVYWDEYPKHSMSDQDVVDAIRNDREKFRGHTDDGCEVQVGWTNEDGTEYLVGLTKCCRATAKGVETGIACRACYGDCEWHLGGEATVAIPRATMIDRLNEASERYDSIEVVVVAEDGRETVVEVDGFGEATDGTPFATARDSFGGDYELWGDGLAENVARGDDDVVRNRWYPRRKS